MKEMKRNQIGYRTSYMGKKSPDSNDKPANAAPDHTAKEHFESGVWQEEAEKIVTDEERMADLNGKREEFTQKKGLSRIRLQLVLLWEYLSAVTSGDYKEYSTLAYLKIVACLLYVVCPFDLIPDFFPWVGWLDDIAIVLYVCGLVKDELDSFSTWLMQMEE